MEADDFGRTLNATAPAPTITKAIAEGTICVTNASAMNQTDPATKIHKV